MDDADDLWRLRIARDAFRRPGSLLASSGSPAFVGKVTTASPMVGHFAAVTPTTVLGGEVAGGAATLTAKPGSVMVYLLGPAAPATGDYLVCRHVDHRWVAERMTGGSGTGGGGSLCRTTLEGLGSTLYSYSGYYNTCLNEGELSTYIPFTLTYNYTENFAVQYRPFQSSSIVTSSGPAWVSQCQQYKGRDENYDCVDFSCNGHYPFMTACCSRIAKMDAGRRFLLITTSQRMVTSTFSPADGHGYCSNGPPPVGGPYGITNNPNPPAKRP